MSSKTELGGDADGWITAEGAKKVIEKTHEAWINLLAQADANSTA